jgi:hypothetical protein
MKNKLFVFGCSFSSPFHENTEEYRSYKNFCGGVFPRTWFDLLSEKLNMKLINCGIPGAGNDMIFMKITQEINKISKGDVVIIGWSFLSRFMWAGTEKKWINMNFGRFHSILNGNENITQNTCDEIVFNRTNEDTFKLYSDIIEDRMSIINYISELVGFDVYYWSCDPYVLYNNPIEKRDNRTIGNKSILMNTKIDNMIKLVESYGGLRIKEETNQKIFDFHLGVSGHKIMGELIYKHIENGI